MLGTLGTPRECLGTLKNPWESEPFGMREKQCFNWMGPVVGPQSTKLSPEEVELTWHSYNAFVS